jgi:hypothetical protein
MYAEVIWFSMLEMDILMIVFDTDSHSYSDFSTGGPLLDDNAYIYNVNKMYSDSFVSCGLTMVVAFSKESRIFEC